MLFSRKIATKWYPFGMLAQNYNAKSYRFGFNGKENDNEVISKGRWQDYGARMYRPDFAIFIPNAFTPDGLGGNETFFFKGYGILEEDFEFYIFDRWGELIYQTNKFEPWDGTYKGLPAKQDVYVYKFIVKDIFDIKHQYIGKVTLLR